MLLMPSTIVINPILCKRFGSMYGETIVSTPAVTPDVMEIRIMTVHTLLILNEKKKIKMTPGFWKYH